MASAGIAMVMLVSACGGDSAGEATTTSAPATTTTTMATTTTTAPPATTTTSTTTTTTLPPLEPVRYQLEVINTWSEETHPGALAGNAHFSYLAGATHDEAATIWRAGEVSSPGVTEMAETGKTTILVEEIAATAGVDSLLSWPYWFCAPATSNTKCGEPTVEFDVNPEYPFVSLAAMIGPSPDWFVGVDTLSLVENGRWVEEITVVLTPWDGGTRSNNDSFALGGTRNDPPEPISAVTETSGQLVGPQPIGSYVFSLVPGS